jgi:hypothetical protein
MPRLSDETCGNCVCFFRPPNTPVDQMPEHIGLCRRYPPQAVKMDTGINWLFPVMQRDGWCHEHIEVPEGYLSATRGN